MKEEFLIKFVSDISHAETLKNNILYMRPAKSFHSYETGVGDIGEGAIFPNLCMYTNINFPIYCMYDTGPIDGKIVISKKLIDVFGAKYLVLIRKAVFCDALQFKFDGKYKDYKVVYGNVCYGRPSKELSTELLKNRSINNLFIKSSFFSYQNEFRVVVMSNTQNKYEEAKLIKDISKNMQILSVEDLFERDESYELELTKIHI